MGHKLTVWKQQHKNAMAIIEQMKRGEWVFKGRYDYFFEANFTCYIAERKGTELWVASGAWFCGIHSKPWELGFFGVLVWHCGAKQRKKALELKMERKPTDLT